MSNEYLKLFDDSFFTLSNKFRSLIASHLNININFDHKLKEIQSLVPDNLFDNVDIIKLGKQLSELHKMLDMKLECTEELNLICCNQNKAIAAYNDKNLEIPVNIQHLSDTYSDVESLNLGSNLTKSNDNSLSGLYDMKNAILFNRNDIITNKKLSLSKYNDDTIQNSITCMTNDIGPLLRKKLNFNMKPNKHKTKKFVPFKKQTLFKNNKDCNLVLKSNNIRLSTNDCKFSSFNKKRKRLSLSNSLIYPKRTKNQPNKLNIWDHEDTRVYCICNKPSYGDMIACDSEKCKIEWFHYKCVDITTSPKGDWFCPMCKME